jgi:hypothetical protein
MSPTKVLQINPELFNMKKGLNKTIKQKEKKVKPLNTTLKSPGLLRKTLLGKIRDFQKKEEETKKTDTPSLVKERDEDKNNDVSEIKTDFNKSLQYLDELSKKRKDTPKNKSEKKQAKRENKTLKRPISSTVGGGQSPYVNLELPTELTEVKLEQPESFSHKMPNNLVPINQVNQVNKPELPLIQPIPEIKPANTPIIIPVINSSSITPVSVNGNETILNFDNATNNNIGNNNIGNGTIQINTNNLKMTDDNKMILPSMNIKPDPPHGVLKGGKKPTYKQYHTLKHNKPHVKLEGNQKNNHEVLNKNKLLDKIKNYSRDRKSNKVPYLKQIKTRTIKYNLGKQKGGKTVAILIKNATTRKKIKDEYHLLKQQPIGEIKEYLRNKNMIKAGTLAPNDVLREMYEQSILSGDITNDTSNTMIHNFLTNK